MQENQEYMNDAEWRLYGMKSDYEKAMRTAEKKILIEHLKYMTKF